MSRRPRAALHRIAARAYAQLAVDRAERASHHARRAASLGHPLKRPLAR